jgi:CubicO group peptidase (beta-lactamase class C family)
MRSIRVAFVVVAVTALSAAEQDTARMEQVVQSHVAAGTFMGSVLVARDGAVVLDKAYGMANLELDVANTPDTKFRLGSVTKQFTAAAILLLEERGQLTIDAPVKSYITGAPAAWDRVRVFNLLTHTAGIPNFTAFATYNEFKGTARSADSIVSLFKDRDLEFGPGEKYNYSNSGYVALGAIIEKVSGVSYEKFIQDHIFTPLGMTDSGYDSNTAIIKRRASGYIKTPAGYLNAGYIHMSIPHAAGALYSTTRDLLKWQQALFAGRVVSKPSLDRMLTPFKNDYGLVLVSG